MTDLALDTKLDEEQQDYLSTFKDSASSLLELISDILDFSKIEAGMIELDRTEFSLRSTIEDPGRLRQILVNLVSNATKFTEEGEIILRVRKRPGRWVACVSPSRYPIRASAYRLISCNRSSTLSPRSIPPRRTRPAAQGWVWPSLRSS